VIKVAYNVPSDHLYNSGNVTLVTDWSFEYFDLPSIPKGAKVKIETTFDAFVGSFGLDNLHVFTHQK
jgi:hypothetical protein